MQLPSFILLLQEAYTALLPMLCSFMTWNITRFYAFMAVKMQIVVFCESSWMTWKQDVPLKCW
jgi:hypothetical protein